MSSKSAPAVTLPIKQLTGEGEVYESEDYVGYPYESFISRMNAYQETLGRGLTDSDIEEMIRTAKGIPDGGPTQGSVDEWYRTAKAEYAKGGKLDVGELRIALRLKTGRHSVALQENYKKTKTRSKVFSQTVKARFLKTKFIEGKMNAEERREYIKEYYGLDEITQEEIDALPEDSLEVFTKLMITDDKKRKKNNRNKKKNKKNRPVRFITMWLSDGVRVVHVRVPDVVKADDDECRASDDFEIFAYRVADLIKLPPRWCGVEYYGELKRLDEYNGHQVDIYDKDMEFVHSEFHVRPCDDIPDEQVSSVVNFDDGSYICRYPSSFKYDDGSTFEEGRSYGGIDDYISELNNAGYDGDAWLDYDWQDGVESIEIIHAKKPPVAKSEVLITEEIADDMILSDDDIKDVVEYCLVNFEGTDYFVNGDDVYEVKTCHGESDIEPGEVVGKVIKGRIVLADKPSE